MTTVATRKKTGKGQRRARLGPVLPDGSRNLVLTDAKGIRCGYEVREIKADFGRGFALTKFEMEQAPALDRTYHVHLDGANGSSCSCPGGSYRDDCKHAAALRALVARGSL